MRVAVPVPVQSVQAVAETAIGHALASHDGTPVEAAHHLAKGPGTAVSSRHKSHRYSADGPTTHHGQDDAARAFHVAAPEQFQYWIIAELQPSRRAGQVKSAYHRLIVRQQWRSRSAAAGKMPRERPRERAESAARHFSRAGLARSAG
jgi:hypothetical protein